MTFARQENTTHRRTKAETPVIALGTATRTTRGVLPGLCDVAIGMPVEGLQRD